MKSVNLTPLELRIIGNALTTQWYIAKDDGNKTLQKRISRLEEKLAKIETEDE